jgi:predicted nucleotidyltransferase
MSLDLSDMEQHSLDIARRFVAAKFPDAECAFVAGSLMRGEGKPHPDIDLVVLYGPNFVAVRREAHAFEGVLIDVFLHNEQAQDFFFDKDGRRGVCALLSMIVEGRVIGKDAALAEKRKRMAKALIEKGPPPLDESELKRRRYFISDLLDDLRDDRPPGEVIGCLSGLFLLLGDFHLRAQNQSGALWVSRCDPDRKALTGKMACDAPPQKASPPKTVTIRAVIAGRSPLQGRWQVRRPQLLMVWHRA